LVIASELDLVRSYWPMPPSGPLRLDISECAVFSISFSSQGDRYERPRIVQFERAGEEREAHNPGETNCNHQMMKGTRNAEGFLLTSAAIVATAILTAPVRASENVSPGHAQLAAQAQVDAADYTTAEILAILDARSEGDAAGENFVLSYANRAEANAAEVVKVGEKQIAASLGVDPADYTLAELTKMLPTVDD
jgi:hypothetical protein